MLKNILFFPNLFITIVLAGKFLNLIYGGYIVAKYFKSHGFLSAILGVLFFASTTAFAMNDLRGELGQFQKTEASAFGDVLGTFEIALTLSFHKEHITFVKCKSLSFNN